MYIEVCTAAAMDLVSDLSFCIIQHCDTVFRKRFSGECSFRLVQILEKKVEVHSNDPTGQYVKFDKIPMEVRNSNSLFV